MFTTFSYSSNHNNCSALNISFKYIVFLAVILMASVSFMDCESEEAKKQKEIEKLKEQMFNDLGDGNYKARTDVRGFKAPKIGKMSNDDSE